MALSKQITMIVTACGRPDLLLKTIESFYSFDSHLDVDCLIYEDSGIPGINDGIMDKLMDYPVTIIYGEKRMGQIFAHDTLMNLIKTPYFLGWEDDWETTNDGFIDDAINHLAEQPRCIQVWLRGCHDTNQHPTIPFDPYFRRLSTSYRWKGFSFAPSVKRLSDYTRIGSFSRYVKFNPFRAWESEYQLGLLYWRMGYHASIFRGSGFVRHIGDGRHVS